MTNRFDPDEFTATDLRIASNEIFPEATYGAIPVRRWRAEEADMKYWLPILICSIAIALLGSAYLMQTVKAYSENRQQRIEQQVHELQDAIRYECLVAFPHDLVVRAQCYQRLMPRSDI